MSALEVKLICSFKLVLYVVLSEIQELMNNMEGLAFLRGSCCQPRCSRGNVLAGIFDGSNPLSLINYSSTADEGRSAG